MAVPACLIFLFFYGLFHNTGTIWDYIALNDGMIGECSIGKDMTGTGHAMSICYPGIHLKLLSVIKEDLQVMRFLQQCSRRFCSSGILGHVSWMGPNILRQPNVIFKDQATKMKLCCLETFGSAYPLPWLHIPKEQNPQGKPVTEVGVPAETQMKNLSDACWEALLPEPVCKKIISFTAGVKFCN